MSTAPSSLTKVVSSKTKRGGPKCIGKTKQNSRRRKSSDERNPHTNSTDAQTNRPAARPRPSKDKRRLTPATKARLDEAYPVPAYTARQAEADAAFQSSRQRAEQTTQRLLSALRRGERKQERLLWASATTRQAESKRPPAHIN